MVKAIAHNAENEMGTVDLRILGNAYVKPERTFVKNPLSADEEEKEADASDEEEGEDGQESDDGEENAQSSDAQPEDESSEEHNSDVGEDNAEENGGDA